MPDEALSRLRVVIADDERPARSFLAALLGSFDDVVVVGEADSGRAALAMIEQERPDLALLDLQMPGLGGLDVVRAVKMRPIPLVAFVTAYDEYAVRAFEVNAIDYLLKPVEKGRLREALNRARDRVEQGEFLDEQAVRVNGAAEMHAAGMKTPFLERIPVRQREEVVLVPVSQIAYVIAEGELLHLTTVRSDVHTIRYRLKDLEARLDPSRFLRLGRGTLANLDLIVKVSAMPGGTHVALLSTGQRLEVSRLQSRILRERFLRL